MSNCVTCSRDVWFCLTSRVLPLLLLLWFFWRLANSKSSFRFLVAVLLNGVRDRDGRPPSSASNARPRLTVHGPVVSVGVDPLVGQHLDVFAAGAAVQLVGAGQPAARAVRQAALLGDVVLEVGR